MSKMVKPLLDVPDLRRAGLEEKLRAVINGMSIDSSSPQRHSITGVITVKLGNDREERIFYKAFIPLVENNRKYLRNLHNLALREEAYLDNIFEKVDPHLVPERLGSLILDPRPPFFLFLRLLEGQPALEKYIELSRRYQNGEHQEELYLERRALLLADLQQIAHFNGKCNSQKNRFSPALESFMHVAYQSYKEALPRSIEHHLKRAVHWKWGGQEYAEGNRRLRNKFSSSKVLKRIRREKELDLRERLQDIFQEREALAANSSLELQHGDCRLQHNFKGRFCDLEDFGYHPPYHDIVTYMSEEIAAPSVGELPSLLAYYLILEKACSSKPSRFTANELSMLEDYKKNNGSVEPLNRLIVDKVGTPFFADFVVGYLAGIIEDDIRINGARKKLSKESLAQLLPRYPHYTVDRLHRSRMKHIEEIYTLITSPDAAGLFQHCSNREGVISYFFHIGKLLNEVGLTRIDHLENLEKPSKSSQYSLFFSLPTVRKSA